VAGGHESGINPYPVEALPCEPISRRLARRWNRTGERSGSKATPGVG
jgi:hypothetical protein